SAKPNRALATSSFKSTVLLPLAAPAAFGQALVAMAPHAAETLGMEGEAEMAGMGAAQGVARLAIGLAPDAFHGGAVDLGHLQGAAVIFVSAAAGRQIHHAERALEAAGHPSRVIARRDATGVGGRPGSDVAGIDRAVHVAGHQLDDAVGHIAVLQAELIDVEIGFLLGGAGAHTLVAGIAVVAIAGQLRGVIEDGARVTPATAGG